MKIYLCSLLILIFSSCSLFSIHSSSQEKDITSKQQAEEIARKKFSQLGYGPIEYYQITVTEKYDKTKWSFVFKGQGEYARPGYHVIIDVDKKTGMTTYMPGE